ncbi:hypothetical protein [Sporomusa malonica]|uniref:Trypsin-like peptidase domain-containing protein n=1 Tax=Sporomusa malonica TaxID=112901 RepID=A0A1W2A4F7_9FIRM|nr:hypothetical protein [Sporomusa malonica]SMC55555.1 hypothetical protein SAMN04488500_10511 [Sporomusa malonica]
MNKSDIPGIFREILKFNTHENNIIGVGRGHKYVRGMNTGQDALMILVKKKYRSSNLDRGSVLPRTMANVPTDVIEVGDIRLLGERMEFRRPAQPGMSLGHYKISAGTFGAVVKDKDTGELLILSNNHVMANITDGCDGRATVGDPIIQPGIYDGGKVEECTIAHLRRFIPLYRETNSPHCKIAQIFEMLLNKCIHSFRPQYQVQVLRKSEKLNLVDCAVATPVNSAAINAEILEFGFVNGIIEPTLGLSIKKSGRTTGVTHSQVLATNITFKVSMSNHEYAVFTDQVLSGPMSMPGDSGSLILTDDNYAVGLLFAGSEQATIFNKITHVLDKLNVTL